MMSEFENLNGTPPEDRPKMSCEDESPIDVSKVDSSSKFVSSASNSKVESPQSYGEDKSGASDPTKSTKVSVMDLSPKKANVAFPRASSVDESPISSSIAESAKVDDSKSSSALVKSKTPDVLSDEKSLKSPEKRRPRLNRRGTYLDDFDFDEPKKPQKDVKVIELMNKNTEKNKPKSKIISLASVRKSSIQTNIPKEKKIILKRKPSTSFDVEEKAKSPSETAPQASPKKKHKPITWP